MVYWHWRRVHFPGGKPEWGKDEACHGVVVDSDLEAPDEGDKRMPAAVAGVGGTDGGFDVKKVQLPEGILHKFPFKVLRSDKGGLQIA